MLSSRKSLYAVPGSWPKTNVSNVVVYKVVHSIRNISML